ncbi:hypothetical protein [Lishizhenia sp.]|uniref:hypothetical protein n=1 Tax=Lishizhenia sp. TaxID=2497594 RepID=UPI00299F2336|nr:hypothetical protein [Lishizhenia sp.]MDX1444937.1 hypothetical protein [Lishizhenia sp.]
MDQSRALSVLKISGFTNEEDLKLIYLKEKERIELSIERAGNVAMKRVYTDKLQELEEAYACLLENKATKVSLSASVPKVKLNRKQWVIICSLIIVVGSVISYFVVQNIQTNNLLEQGMIQFNAEKLSSNPEDFSKAKEYFEKAEQRGSLKGKFYHGLMLFKMGDREIGMIKMQTADKAGYQDTTIHFNTYLNFKQRLDVK